MSKQFFYILVATCATALIWVVVDIIHSRQQVELPTDVQKLIEPLDPNFDQEALNLL